MRTTLLPLLGMAVLLVGVTPSAILAEEPPPRIHEKHKHDHASVITLEDAIAKALEAAPRLKASAANMEAAEGLQEQAGYWPNPRIGMEAEDIAVAVNSVVSAVLKSLTG